MDRLRIREYRSGDYHAVRRLYAAGFTEKTPALFAHALTRPRVRLALLAPLLGVLVLSGGSVPATLAAAAVLLCGTRLAVGLLLERGVRLGLREDLQDIGASYMTPGRGACFWVAEEEGDGGAVVGTVGVLPCVTEPGAWELKRISVRRDWRGRGVARALCGVAVAFAARSGGGGGGGGVRRLVLYTSVLQGDAQRLYLRLGFRKEAEFVWPSPAARLLGFTVFKYGLDVTPDGGADA